MRPWQSPGIIYNKEIQMKIYNKLVRDRIPEIIEKQGKICHYEVMSDDAYKAALNAKLTEELKEYHESGELEELADLLEVIYAIAESRGETVESLNELAEKKALARGRFQEKYLLLSVEE